MADAKAGLQDMVIGTTAISDIDGERGTLTYRGYDILDLAEQSSFDEVVYLLWNGRLPTGMELDEFQDQLTFNRELPAEILDLLKRLPKGQHPMDVLRTAVSALALYDSEAADNSLEANQRKALRLTAQMGALVAAYDRIRHNKPPIAAVPKLGRAANFLYMLTGAQPSDEAAHWFDVALLLHADHSFNASTFAARITASTLSDLHSAVTSAIGTLKGPLHGGANEQVMKMLLEIQTTDQVEPYIQNLLAQKKKVMGFGHRVYQTVDPRATVLAKMSEELGRPIGQLRWFKISKKIEEVMIREKNINANVDFYSASAYYILGIPTDLYPMIFAVSRISGWCAHILEQYANNKLIRPLAEYTGPKDLKYVPIQERGN